MRRFRVLGVMSGTSLDGLDLACSDFTVDINNKWTFAIVKAQTIPYTTEWRSRLNSAFHSSAYEIMKLDAQYGCFIGENICKFLKINDLSVDFIASHGHTVFHRPDEGFTCQIGNGASIAATTGIETICNFRNLDVALQGQGAPLVPIGDQMLFANYDYCLNLGGFANISHQRADKRIAFDICPVNIVVNDLCNKIGMEYDKDGILGSKGTIIPDMLLQLNSLPFYSQPTPKSLGREWVENEVFPIINYFQASIEDKIQTFYQHIVNQINSITKEYHNSSILVTGGGAHNSYLIKLLQETSNNQIVIPEKTVVDFKEALIFAFLGVLRKIEQVNCLKSVTGATFDNIGGVIYKR